MLNWQWEDSQQGKKNEHSRCSLNQLCGWINLEELTCLKNIWAHFTQTLEGDDFTLSAWSTSLSYLAFLWFFYSQLDCHKYVFTILFIRHSILPFSSKKRPPKQFTLKPQDTPTPVKQIITDKNQSTLNVSHSKNISIARLKNDRGEASLTFGSFMIQVLPLKRLWSFSTNCTFPGGITPSSLQRWPQMMGRLTWEEVILQIFWSHNSKDFETSSDLTPTISASMHWAKEKPATKICNCTGIFKTHPTIYA